MYATPKKRFLIIIFTCLLAVIVGCRSRPPLVADRFGEPKAVILEVSIDYAVASASEVKRQIATPVASRLVAMPMVDQITAVCETDGYRAYIEVQTADESGFGRQLLKDLKQVDLPAGAGKPRVALVASVPRIRSSCQALVVADLDPQRLAALGLTVEEARRQIPKDALTDADDPDQVGQMVLRTPDKKGVRLEDVAQVYVTCGPPAIIVDKLAPR